VFNWPEDGKLLVPMPSTPPAPITLNPSHQRAFWKQCEEEFSAHVTNLTPKEAEFF
jgi:hypothetical protein